MVANELPEEWTQQLVDRFLLWLVSSWLVDCQLNVWFLSGVIGQAVVVFLVENHSCITIGATKLNMYWTSYLERDAMLGLAGEMLCCRNKGFVHESILLELVKIRYSFILRQPNRSVPGTLIECNSPSLFSLIQCHLSTFCYWIKTLNAPTNNYVE